MATQIAWPTASCEAEAIKESTKTKWKAEIVSVFSKFSSLQIWNMEKEKDSENEKVGDRLAKLNKNKSDRELDCER